MTLDKTLFVHPETDRTWTLPASIVNTESPILLSAVTAPAYPDYMLAGAMGAVMDSIARTTTFTWWNLPPVDNPLRAHFDNTAAFYTALRPITNTRFLKAVENYMFKSFKLRLDEAARTQLSRIAAEFTQGIADRRLDYTTDFSWKPGDFGDRGSCYWNHEYYNHSRVRDFPKLGAFAMREWDDRNRGKGRAWIVPVPRRIAPDFPAFQVMNAYGSLKDLQPHPAYILARHLHDLTGVAWQVPSNVSFRVYDAHSNGDSMIVLPADVTVPDWDDRTIYASDVDLPRPMWAIHDKHAKVECAECENYFHEDDLDGDGLCADCAAERRNHEDCECCGSRTHIDDLYYVESADGRYCESCYHDNFTYIERLDNDYNNDDIVWIAVDGDNMPYVGFEYGETWTVCEFTMTPILTADAATVNDADHNEYTVDASLVETYCVDHEEYDFPVVIAAVDTFRTADYYEDRKLRYALDGDDWRRLCVMNEPRPLHWLDLPADYTAPAPVEDVLTIPMQFA